MKLTKRETFNPTKRKSLKATKSIGKRSKGGFLRGPKIRLKVTKGEYLEKATKEKFNGYQKEYYNAGIF